MAPLNLEFLAYEETPIGMIGLRRRELLSRPGTVVTEITLDHELLMSSHHTDSERALASAALDWHPGDGLRVRIGGLGLGYTARAVLESERVAKVEVVELLPQVIDWVRDGRVPLSAELNADPRLDVVEGDVYAMLDGPAKAVWDLVLIDVDHSPEERLGEDNEGFYGAAGLARSRAHLAPGGVLGVWSYAESPRFEETLRSVFDEVAVLPVHFFNGFTEEDETNWVFLARDA